MSSEQTANPAIIPDDHYQRQLVEYARQTRSATMFIAWIIGIGVAIALIIGIIVGVQTAKVASELNNNGTSTSSNCLSQGGTDPSC